MTTYLFLVQYTAIHREHFARGILKEYLALIDSICRAVLLRLIVGLGV